MMAEPSFVEELRALLNRRSMENNSGTPDFILATFLSNVLVDYEDAVNERDRWWGDRPAIRTGGVAGLEHALQVAEDAEEDGR